MRESSVSICPVPSEQQPLNEYQQLQDSWFFRWGILGRWVYGRKLTWVWFWGWILTGPIAAASFPPLKAPIPFFLCSTIGALILVLLVLARLYLGWSYVRDRLNKKTVFYEESGWYDGQTWQKPQSVIARDNLIVAYEIQPILTRIKITFAIIIGIIGVDGVSWLAAIN